jgi:hypothetical protein
MRKESVKASMVALLEPFEVLAHARRFPASIALESGDVIPVGIVRIDQDHRVVGAAASQSAGARIEDAAAIRYKLGIATLLGFIVVVAHEEVPPHRGIFGSECVERGGVVVGGKAVLAGVDGVAARKEARVAAGLQEGDAATLSARRAATVPPPTPEPTTMYSQFSTGRA